MRTWPYALACLLSAGCALQRAEIAQQAQHQMVGLSREQVLQCMGPPANKMADGATEVWSYESGNNHTAVFGHGYSTTTGSIDSTTTFGSRDATTTGSVNANTSSFGSAVATTRHCTVNVVMANGYVSRVNYAGPTGGLITEGEQCAFAVQNCTK
jgi:hypothetical protein